MSELFGSYSQATPEVSSNSDGPFGRQRFLAKCGTVSQNLVLRELSSNGDFIRTITCKPGTITLIQGRDSIVRPFAEALCGRNAGSTVMLRFGSRELYESEIHVVGRTNCSWRGVTVADALKSVGAPANFVLQLLECAGLAETRDRSSEELSEGEVQRLNIICSLYSRSLVLSYDSPFIHMAGKWVERLSVLLEEAVRDSGKIVVMTGLERIPEFWKSSRSVLIERIGPARTRKMSFVSSEEQMQLVVSKVRTLLENSRNVDTEDEYFITRPMAIKHLPVRAAVPEAIQTEAIVNPDIIEILPGLRADDFSSAQVREAELANGNGSNDGKGKARYQTGIRNSLTRVSGIHRLLKNSVVFRKLYYFNQWLERVLLPRTPKEAIQPAVRISRLRRKNKLYRNLAIPLLLIVLTSFCYYCFIVK